MFQLPELAKQPVPSINYGDPYMVITYGYNHLLDYIKERTSDNTYKYNTYAYNKYQMKSLNEVSVKYLNMKHALINKAFFKIWELVFDYKLIDNSKSFISMHIADAPGAFTQFTSAYRYKLTKTYDSSKHYANSIQTDDELFNFKTSNLQTNVTILNGSGDLTDTKMIGDFSKQINKASANFITADGGFTLDNEGNQEIESIKLIIGEVLTALEYQAKHGHFVCKVFTLHTQTMIDILYILTACYKEVYITKPLTSREVNSEKYIVCKYFNAYPAYLTQVKTMLHTVLDKGIYPARLVSDAIDDKFSEVILAANKHFNTEQYIAIDNIVNKRISREDQVEGALNEWKAKYMS